MYILLHCAFMMEFKMAALCNLDFLTALSPMLLFTHFWSLDVFSRSWNLMGIIYLPYFISLCPKTNSLMLFYNSINFQKSTCNNNTSWCTTLNHGMYDPYQDLHDYDLRIVWKLTKWNKYEFEMLVWVYVFLKQF